VTKTVGKSLAGKKISGSDDFAAHLLESRKVALVPGTGFGAPSHVRLSFATSMENIVEGLDRIEAFINDLQ
jgi:aspartate aminotransferase